MGPLGRPKAPAAPHGLALAPPGRVFGTLLRFILGPFLVPFGSPGLRFFSFCHLRVSMLALCILRGRQQSEKVRFCEGPKLVWHGKYAVQLNVAKFAPKTRFGAI